MIIILYFNFVSYFESTCSMYTIYTKIKHPLFDFLIVVDFFQIWSQLFLLIQKQKYIVFGAYYQTSLETISIYDEH